MIRNFARGAQAVARNLRPATRPGHRAYLQSLRARRALSAAPPEEQEAYRIAELRRAVRVAASALPFWRHRFSQAGLDWSAEFTYSEFSRVPPLTREEIADAAEELVNPNVPIALRGKMATGGSSGIPTATWTGPVERGWRESAARFFEELAGIPTGARFALLWGHNLDPIARSTLRDRFEDWILNRRWFDCFRLSRETLLDYHRQLQEFRPQVLQAYTTALVSLAEVIREERLAPPRYPTIGFITGAEKLYPWQRDLIESVFGRPVFERYGGRDLGQIAMQVDSSPTLIVDWANVHVEVEGGGAEGGMLVTKFHADAMPMFRYRSTDIVRGVSDGPGHPLLAIQEVVGRSLQRIWNPDGTWVTGVFVPHLLKDFPLRSYQLRQASDYAAELLIVPAPDFTDGQEQEILDALRKNLSGVELKIIRVNDIEKTASGKWLPVVSAVRSSDGRS